MEYLQSLQSLREETRIITVLSLSMFNTTLPLMKKMSQKQIYWGDRIETCSLSDFTTKMEPPW